MRRISFGTQPIFLTIAIALLVGVVCMSARPTAVSAQAANSSPDTGPVIATVDKNRPAPVRQYHVICVNNYVHDVAKPKGCLHKPGADPNGIAVIQYLVTVYPPQVESSDWYLRPIGKVRWQRGIIKGDWPFKNPLWDQNYQGLSVLQIVYAPGEEQTKYCAQSNLFDLHGGRDLLHVCNTTKGKKTVPIPYSLWVAINLQPRKGLVVKGGLWLLENVSAVNAKPFPGNDWVMTASEVEHKFIYTLTFSPKETQLAENQIWSFMRIKVK